MSRHNDEIRSIIMGKTITKVEFTGGMSGHCNFIKEIHLNDGSICDFTWSMSSDTMSTFIRGLLADYPNLVLEKEIFPMIQLRGERKQ